MTGTATIEDERNIKQICDMKDPVVLRKNPVTSNHMYFKMKRPPASYGFRGKEKDMPSTLGLLNLLILDKFIECIKNGTEPKNTMIFVQSYQEGHLFMVQSKYILQRKD